ncbi:leucine-rich repeat neuronal protein 3-like [Macrobrachium nipponense]|uniref:leucine-rich repeat neuronal protein 3-like n=1 Tax=Macrobrachium nipponense TaxID=159736 RepID=UPI0030C7AF20
MLVPNNIAMVLPVKLLYNIAGFSLLCTPNLCNIIGENMISDIPENNYNSSCCEGCTSGVMKSTDLTEDLETLNCSMKKIRTFPVNLPVTLQALNLKGNNIFNIPDNSMSYLTDLQELDLSANRIKSIGQGSIFANLLHLKYLNVENNFLTSLYHNSLLGLTSLRHLVLSNNKITFLEEGALAELKSLQRLDLDHNLLESLYEHWFHGLEHLLTLNIAHNRILNIPASVFQTLVSLKYLYLSGNQISSVHPRAFFGQISLEVLSVENNLLNKAPTAAFQGIPSLKILILDRNPLSKIKPLDFSHLGITEISLCHMPKLSIVDAKGFYNLLNISSIHMSDNKKLTYVDPLAFMNVDNLKVLQLHDNVIKGISPEMKSVLPNGVQISLYNNPFTCDCNIRWLRQLMEDSFSSGVSLVKPEQLVCHGPENLAHKLIKDLNIKSIPRVCAPTVLNLTQSDTVSGRVGESFLLECRSLGYPMPRLHWVLPDGSFVNSTLNEIRRRFFLPGTLVYYHLLPSDGGQYTCLAHNSIGDASLSLNINISGIDIYLFPIRVSSNFITLTWNGTEHQTFASYKINYWPVDANGKRSGPLESMPAGSSDQNIVINRLKPQTTYYFCLGFEDKTGFFLKISCCLASTQHEDFMLQGISGTSNVMIAIVLIIVLAIIVLGICLASIVTKRYRHRLYEVPDNSDTSIIPLKTFVDLFYQGLDPQRTEHDQSKPIVH